MLSPKEIDLVKRIHDKTLSGNLKWGETGTCATYEVSFPNSSIMITYRQIPSSEQSIVLQIINNNGDLIREIDDDEYLEINRNSYDYFLEIYDKARSIALNVEGTIDDLLSVL